MSFNAYFKTDLFANYETYDALVALRDKWKEEMLVIIRDWGFSDCRAHIFNQPSSFLVKCEVEAPRKGPKIPGFNGGNRIRMEGGSFYEYTLAHNKSTTDKRGRLDHLEERHMQPEVKAATWPRVDFDYIAASRLGVSAQIREGGTIWSTGTWMLDRAGSQRTLIISVPISKSKGQYVIPVPGEAWTEITCGEFAALLNGHNNLTPAIAEDGHNEF